MSVSRKVLLFVLSSEALRSRFNQMLAATPHAAFYSFDGADGFDRFLEARPDLCFVSEATSRISGSILCQLIREHRLSKGAGVYMLSPRWQDQELVDRLQALGVDGVLPEPPDPAQMTDILSQEHAFAGEAIDALEDEVLDQAQAPVPLPVAAGAGEVFASGESHEAQSLSVHLGPPSATPEHRTTTPAAVVELTPAMQKRPGPDLVAATAPVDAADREDATSDNDDAPPFTPLPASSHDPGSLENAMLSLAQVSLSEPADRQSDAVDDGDDASNDSSASPFGGQDNPPVEATTAQHHVPPDVALAKAPSHNAIPEAALLEDGGPVADGAADDVSPVLPSEGHRAATAPVEESPAAAEHDAPDQKVPSPVAAAPGSVVLATTRDTEDLSPIEEPTPVEDHPASSWDLDPVNEESDVFEKEESQGSDRDAHKPPAAASPNDEAPKFASLEQTDLRAPSPTNTSGIFPLSAEERDSHTIRQAITDSQLGGRLTRRILALYRLLDSVDYYQLLGVAPTADGTEIQGAYHALALEYHPDRFFVLNPGFIKDRVASLFMRITEAYSVLGHAGRRARYDALLAEAHDGGPPRFTLGESSVDEKPAGSEAQTPVGRKYLRLAFAAMARGDLDAAHLNLTFAVGHEPDNAHLRDRLNAVETQLRSAPKT